MFTRGSRYEHLAEAEHVTADGRTIRYKRIRFLPSAPGTGTYGVEQGDRPDLAAWAIAQDPEVFWRLCDANFVAQPAALTAVPGRRIVIPDPSGGQEG